jgi:hypothetical protein
LTAVGGFGDLGSWVVGFVDEAVVFGVPEEAA